MKHVYLFLIILTISLHISEAQPSAERIFSIHPRIGAVYNLHIADFGGVPPLLSCGQYKSGSGIGFDGYFGIQKDFFSNINLGLSIGYTDRSAELKSEDIIDNFARNTETGLIEIVKTQSLVDLHIAYLGIQPEFRYTLDKDFIRGPLSLYAAPIIGIPIVYDFNQREKIISPEYAAFDTDKGAKQERLLSVYENPDFTSPAVGISIGVENLTKIGKSLYISNLFLVDYNFNDFHPDFDWKFLSFKINVGLQFDIMRLKPELIALEDVQEIPELPVPPQEIQAPEPEIDLTILGLKAEVNTGNELVSTVPLVNAIFFDRNSSLIPSYYKLNAGDFSFIYGDAVEAHNYVIPRIVSILNNNSGSSIILKGATAGKEIEPEGAQLAEKRVNAARQAFIAAGASPYQIKTSYSEFPDNPSSLAFEKSIEENMRVDIVIQKAPLLEYVSSQKYAEAEVQVYFASQFEHVDDKEHIWLENNIDEKIVYPYQPGSESVLELTQRIQPQVNELPIKLLLHYRDKVDSASTVVSIKNAVHNIVELNLEDFNAILTFNYNSSALKEENKALLRQLLSILPPDAVIMVSGNADELGSEERNRELVAERAKNTVDFLNSISKKKLNIEIVKDNHKAAENTPQGRFINRSIRIRLR